MHTDNYRADVPGHFGWFFRTFSTAGRFTRSWAVVLAVIGIAQHAALATTYYVDAVNGNNENTGTSDSTPWKSMLKVESAAAPGSQIVVLAWNDALVDENWPANQLYRCEQVYQYGITWMFDHSYQIGRYVNGDFWVLGPVRIVAFDPKCVELQDVRMYGGTSFERTIDRVINGSNINPVAQSHGYDSAAAGYSASRNVALGVSSETPLDVAVGGTDLPIKSLVSSISRPAADIGHTYDAHLTDAAVLTVVSSIPPANAFRPAFCGDSKWEFTADDIHWNFLRSLKPVGWQPSLGYLERYLKRPWIMHGRHINGSALHPINNMFDQYGRDFARRAHWAALLLNMDYPQEQKKTLLHRFLQYGIDVSGMMRSPEARRILQANGGFTNGRKLPSVFAAKLLGSAEIAALHAKAGQYLYQVEGHGPGNPPEDFIHFGNEDCQVFYVTQADVDATQGPSWSPDTRADQEIPYESDDIGLPEWGIQHDWHPECSNAYYGAYYRAVSGCTMPSAALAVLMIDAKSIWNNDAFFDYADRWMAICAGLSDTHGYKYGTNGIDLHADQAFVFDTWNAYRANYGPIWPNTASQESDDTDGPGDNPVDASGPQITAVGGRTVSAASTLSFSIAENATLNLSVSASDPDNDAITYSASGLPSGASFTDQDFSWTPTYDQAGTYRVTFSASDGQNQDTETVTITVTNVNRGPALSTIGDQTVDEQTLLAFNVSADDLDGDTVQYAATGLPFGATFSGSSFRWTPTSDQVGAYEVTFVASDGQFQDSETVTLYVMGTGPDSTAPTVVGYEPEPGAIQVSLNNLIALRVSDAGHGVNPESVVIEVNGNTVYQGNVSVYTSDSGQCTRSGNWASYRFIYQPNETFGFDQIVTVGVSASDQANNALDNYSYSFTTEMRAFGTNETVGGDIGPQSHPVTVGDASGNIWAAWHAGPNGSRDIYVARKAAQADAFGTALRLTADAADQRNPDIAMGADGRLYLVWQDNSRDNWDLYVAMSSDGMSWSRPTQVTNTDDNETNPAVAVDPRSPAPVYVAWQDDRNGNTDIYVASSTNAFVDSEIWAVTANSASQYDPDIAVDGAGTAYVIWTDTRSQRADIYGAASSGGAWTNVAVVTTNSNQLHPALAVDPATSVLHLAWEDDAPGHTDIYYAKSEGLPGNPVVGSTIIDDTTGADQLAPAVVCQDSGHVFAAWQDMRHKGDTDLFMTELGSGAAKTNVLVGDNGTNTDQGEPALGIDGYGNPYLVWTDSRDANTEVYCAATTFVDPTPLDSKMVIASEGATVGPAPATIDEPDDVSITVPAGACQCDVRITISEILNPQAMPAECLGSYDFGPSGIDFDEPVTVTIPYRFAGTGNAAKPYWYDSLTGALSQQGITDIENIVVADDLYALRFKTTHFTPFYLMASEVDTSGGADGSGGCSVSATSKGSPKELLLPYGLLALAMLALRYRDQKRRRLLSNDAR